MNKENIYTIVDLFAGAGGLSEGFVQAGFMPIAHVEMDKDALELVKDFSKDDYDKEVFVFSPKGDLYKLTKGATVLDFAYLVHTNIGNKCVGAKVDEKNQSIRYQIKSGDTIEILTSPQQKPKQDWLNFVVTKQASSKIKQWYKKQNLYNTGTIY